MQATVQVRTARAPEEILAEQINEIHRDAHDREEALRSCFRACQSPLEQIFMLEYIQLYGALPTWYQDRFIFNHTIHGNQSNLLTTDNCVSIFPQFQIRLRNKTYRVDFMITIFPLPNASRQFNYLAVEIDGHDYHERTKEQAAKDRSRDRAMLAAGYKVVRFTGSEIYRSPMDALYELSDFIIAMCV